MFGVCVVLGLDVLEFGDASGFVFHAMEVGVEPIVVVDGVLCESERLGHVEHALFEDVVESRRSVSGLYFVQESACFGAEAHLLPDVCVECAGIGEYAAIRIRFLEHVGGEWHITVPVHDLRIYFAIPCNVATAHLVFAVSGGQVEEFAAGERTSGGAVHVCVDDGAPYGLWRAISVTSSQEDRRFAVITVTDADHAAQVRVVVALGSTCVGRLVIGRAIGV